MSQGRNDPCACGSGKKYKKCCQVKTGTAAPGGAAPEEVRREAQKIAGVFNVHQALQAALTHHQAGRLLQADEIYQQILQVEPRHQEALRLLGMLAHQSGQSETALELINYAIQANLGNPLPHNNLGDIYQSLNRFEEAAACYQQAIKLEPDYAEAHNNLGNALYDQGKFGEAAASYQEAIAIDPKYIEAYSNLGTVFNEQGEFGKAVVCYQKAIALNPDFAGSYYNLGITLNNQGKLDEAIVCCRKALALKPDFAEAYNRLGIALNEQGNLEEAATAYRQALILKPGYADAYNNLGITLRDQGKLYEAIACYRKTLALKPDFAEAYSNLASIFRMLGRNSEAVELYRAALNSKPTCDMHTALIFTLDLAEKTSNLELQNERKKWAEIYATPFLRYRAHANDPDAKRRLRIGYVSATIGGSGFSSTKIFGAMLARFDRSQFDVVVYSNLRSEDETALYYKQRVTNWKMIAGQSDDAVAELIRQDGIDILVDLSGHCAGNRLLVFARKPAPIQITAWGYTAGTGMQAMDVMFSDPVCIQPDEKHLYTEEVRYLPCSIVYFHPEEFPATRALPVLSAKHITFGMFNRLAKVSDECFDVWVRLLLVMPNSRLLVKTTELEDQDVKNQFLERLAKAGIDIARVVLLGRTSWFEHMNAFSQIDIALDPFPQGGGVATLECLAMGTPIVTLRWMSIAGRTSASILTALGLTDWIAETPEQYVEIAIRKARDIAALADLRRQIRSGFMSSVIGDAPAYVRTVEREYRQLWQEWCDRKQDVPQPFSAGSEIRCTPR